MRLHVRSGTLVEQQKWVEVCESAVFSEHTTRRVFRRAVPKSASHIAPVVLS